MHAINKEVVNPEEDVIVQIHLSKPAILLNKDKFIIRNSSGDKTIGGHPVENKIASFHGSPGVVPGIEYPGIIDLAH